jgi:ankyrin repeat protein
MSSADLTELLDSGICVNDPDESNQYMLSTACARLQTDSVRLLLERGANPNVRNSEGDTPLLSTINVVSHNPSAALEIARMLLDAGADIEMRGYMDKTPFLKACSRGDLDILKLLVARGCDVRAVADDAPGPVDGEWLAGVFGGPPEFREYLRGIMKPGHSGKRSAADV